MIHTICSERQISQNGNTGHAWSLPIFHMIEYENDNIATLLGDHPAMLLYKSEVMERRWEGILKLSTSHVWLSGKTPFTNSGIKRLLDGQWLNDDVINAYLELCACLRSDVKFLATQWFPGLQTWGPNVKKNAVRWVSLFVHFIKYNLIVSGAQISKGAADVTAAMKAFTAVIAVINYPNDHWVVLQFNPERQMLQVLDSMAPIHDAHRMQKFRKVRYLPLLTTFSDDAP